VILWGLGGGNKRANAFRTWDTVNAGVSFEPPLPQDQEPQRQQQQRHVVVPAHPSPDNERAQF
jgi:hypothetical protein